MMPSVASPKVDISVALTIGGWMTENELLWLATQACFRQKIVEFGSFHGRSARALADNLSEGGHLWCVDPWTGSYKHENGMEVPINTYVMPIFVENLKDRINEGKVTPVRQFSYNFSLQNPVDMVFIDGDHRYETVVKDIKKAFELLRPSGLICGHDYGEKGWPGVKRAVTELIGEVEVIDTIWHTLKS